MSGAGDARFIVRDPEGNEVPVGSVEELQARVERSEVHPDADLFDASTGQWAPARTMPVFRFLLEELELDGRLPDRFREIIREEPDGPEEPDASGAEDVVAEAAGEPGDAGAAEDDREDAAGEPSDVGAAEPGEAVSGVDDDGGDGEVDPAAEAGDRQAAATDDPFDLRMDLVEVDPFGPAPRESQEEGEQPADARAETDPESVGEEPEAAPGAPDPAPPGDLVLDDGPPRRAAADHQPDVDAYDPPDPPDPADPHERPEDGGAASEPAPGSGDRAKADRGKDDDRWFTPASEGGMVLPIPDDAGDEAPAARWEPEDDEDARASAPHRPLGPGARPRVVGLLVVAGVVCAAWVFITSADSEPDPVEPPPAPVVELAAAPSAPAGLEEPVDRILAAVDEGFVDQVSGVRQALGLDAGPPPDWLGGYYLANAGEFPGVTEFWEGYLAFLEEMRERDPEIYRGAVAGALDEEGLAGSEREDLDAYFDRRYELQEAYRQQHYGHLDQTARAALRLHELLQRHESEIVHSPALGQGVSADPILEAVIPDGPTGEEVERALDRVFLALDRSRRGGPPSPEGLRAELFRGLGDAF